MPITEKREWLLALLHANNNEPIESAVRLMKELFLIRKEIGEKQRMTDRDFYNFQPYLYGPCSFEVYKDIKRLASAGLIEVLRSPKSRWSIYRITKKGEEYIDGMVEHTPKIIEEIKLKFNKMPFMELLRYVYNKYPQFTKKSVMTLSIFDRRG